ncbi:MAG TPA: dipicolinate synthase subunit B [Bacillota bacterium]|nr:dipicolinate synthase subunit B [Bacillota bacterium]
MGEKLRIGFGLTGSHCTIPDIWNALQALVDEGADIFPIVSESVRSTDTRFGSSESILGRLKTIAGREPWTKQVEVEPIGPKKLLDVMVVAPCTGTTMAKLALGISDTVVTLACKAQMRNNRPVVLGISTNDGLGANSINLGYLMTRKNLYFVPFCQDNPENKEQSLVSLMDLIPDTISAALSGKQLQPILYEPK